jgi:hypothetical protein
MAKYALCIGINNYPGTHMDLAGCVNDANDWAAELAARGFTVTRLLDKAATKAAMVAAFSAVIGQAVKNDVVVITFSGHGTYAPDQDGDEADGLDEALCPYDIQTGGGPLLDDELHALFSTCRAGVKLVLISDSCHSGTVSRAAPTPLEDSDGPRPRFMPMGNWLPDADAHLPRGPGGRAATTIVGPAGTSPFTLPKSSGALLLAGCKEGPNNFSYDARIQGRPNGAFTFYALKVLRTLPATATYADWQAALTPACLPSASYPQVPQLFGSATAKNRRIFA